MGTPGGCLGCAAWWIEILFLKIMKYCTAKDAKLRLQSLCELCDETVNGNLQSACFCGFLSSPDVSSVKSNIVIEHGLYG